MSDYSEKELRNVFACMLRITKGREPLIKLISSSTIGWSKATIKIVPLDLLEGRLKRMLQNCSIESLLLLQKYTWLDRNPINRIAVNVLRRKNLYGDDRFKRLRKPNESRKFF